MGKEYNSALQARVEQFLKDKNISQAKAAPLMGISQTALSQYRRSMYDNGDIAALESFWNREGTPLRRQLDKNFPCR